MEEAIMDKFPEARICEVRHHDKFGTRVLGVVPARNEFDKDHIVEWTDNGMATECYTDDRDYREVHWNKEEQTAEYIDAKLLIRNEVFDVSLDATE